MTGKRALTGDRPTGRLHLGHLVGSLQNRIRLQSQYDIILVVADLHTLTTRPDRDALSQLPDNVRGIVLDYLAAGIDPDKVTICLQSAIPEVYELNTLFENLVTVNRLAQIPSIKEMARDAHLDEGALPFGLMGYPVLQAADILLARAQLVPVGKDSRSCRGRPRDRAALQYALRGGLPGAGTVAQQCAVPPRYRWKGENVQVGRERDLPVG